MSRSREAPRRRAGSRTRFAETTTGSVMVAFLSVVLAVAVGSIMILFTDENVRKSFGYVGSRPGDLWYYSRDAITGAYSALFRGAIYNSEGTDFQSQIRPLTETLKFAAPLIMAGLGVGLAFRAGLFNIGGRGQMLLAGAGAAWVAINVDAPTPSTCPSPWRPGRSPERCGAGWSACSRPAPGRTR